MRAAHALLSASSAQRWIRCPPSARLSATKADRSTKFSEEGTEAHELGCFKVKQSLGLVGKEADPTSTLKYFTSEMDAHTTDYAVFVLELFDKAHDACREPMLILEEKLDYSRWAQEGFGTVDALVIADSTMYVCDFKFGANLVSAEDNAQLRLYALAALETYGYLYDIEKVCMCIFQPRREHISMSVKSVVELYEWAETVVKPAAELAYAGEGSFCPGEHCTYCRVAAECRARAEHFQETVQKSDTEPVLLTDIEISELLSKLDGFISWAKSVQDFAFSAALKGKQWPGFKLVAGRQGNRSFSDKKAVEAAALEAGYSDIYKKDILNLTDLERLFGKDNFKTIFGNFVTRAPGKPTLVPESVKGTAIQIQTAAEIFSAEPISEEDI